MTRYEHILNGGVEEMAKMIAYILYKHEEKVEDCEVMQAVVKATTPIFIEWLNEEVEA